MVKVANFKIRILLPLTLSILALIPGAAMACPEIQKDNERISKELGEQKAVLDQLELAVVSMETSCRTEETQISAKGAASATAESCVALKETAAMNDQLTHSSSTCAQNIDITRGKLDLLTVQFVAPQEEALEAVVELDKGLTILQQLCGKELKQTKQLQDYSTQLLQISKMAIVKAQAAVKNFSDLSAKTTEFSQSSKGALARCGLMAEAPLVAATAPRNLGGRSGPGVPAGQSPEPASTVTGNVHSDKLDSLLARSGAKRPGAAAPSAENARYPVAKAALDSKTSAGAAAPAPSSAPVPAMTGLTGLGSGIGALGKLAPSSAAAAAQAASGAPSVADSIFAEGDNASLVLRAESAKAEPMAGAAEAKEVSRGPAGLSDPAASASAAPTEVRYLGELGSPTEVRYLGELSASTEAQPSASADGDLFQRVHKRYQAQQGRMLKVHQERLSLAD